MARPHRTAAVVSVPRAAAIAGLLLIAAVAGAQAEDFYKGKQIRLIIGNNAGTSYDATARLVSAHIPRHIPGAPRLVTQNMPGATGLIAANYVATVAPEDGTVISAAHQSLPLRQLFGDKQVKYDAARLQWIGSPQASVALIAVWHAAPVQSMEQAKSTSSVFGATTARASAATVIALANNLIGTRFRLALGYNGNHIDLAMERGEVHGRAGQSWSGWKATRPEWIRDGKIRVIAQLGLKPDPELKGVPLMADLAKDERSRRILRLFSAQTEFGRPIYAAAGVPKDRVAVLRRAFDAMLKDDRFVAEAKRLNHDIAPTSGAELDRLVAEMMATPKELLAEAETAQDYRSGAENCATLSGQAACAAKKKKQSKESE